MRILTAAAAFILGLAIALGASAAEPTKVEVGKTTIFWSELPGVDGRKHSMAEFDKCEVVVIATTCNHCPIAIEYYERMKEFSLRYCGKEGKVALVAVSLSNLETDRLPRMKQMAKRQGFNFPYLYDESQELGKSLGATNTPQFFVLDRNRLLVYRGAWDDNLNATHVQRTYVVDAIEALLAGKSPSVAETKAKGCPIDYNE
ncbi:MAG: thioredoxin family protein [Pirellulaceae bacterium]